MRKNRHRKKNAVDKFYKMHFRKPICSANILENQFVQLKRALLSISKAKKTPFRNKYRIHNMPPAPAIRRYDVQKLAKGVPDVSDRPKFF